jgi:hypothetical protein
VQSGKEEKLVAAKSGGLSRTCILKWKVQVHVCQAGCAQLPAYVTAFVKVYKPGSSNFTVHVSLPSSDVVILSLLDGERLAISAISWLLLNSTLCQLPCATYRVNPDIVSHMPDHRLYFESNQ